MLSIYFLIGVFATSIVLTAIGVFLGFRWWDSEKGGGAALLALVMFIIACVSGTNLFWRLEASDKAAAVQRQP